MWGPLALPHLVPAWSPCCFTPECASCLWVRPAESGGRLRPAWQRRFVVQAANFLYIFASEEDARPPVKPPLETLCFEDLLFEPTDAVGAANESEAPLRDGFAFRVVPSQHATIGSKLDALRLGGRSYDFIAVSSELRARWKMALRHSRCCGLSNSIDELRAVLECKEFELRELKRMLGEALESGGDAPQRSDGPPAASAPTLWPTASSWLPYGAWAHGRGSTVEAQVQAQAITRLQAATRGRLTRQHTAGALLVAGAVSGGRECVPTAGCEASTAPREGSVLRKVGSCASSKVGSCASKMSHSASKVGHSVGVSVGAAVGSAVAAVTGASPAPCLTLEGTPEDEPSEVQRLSATRLQAAARGHLARSASREAVHRKRASLMHGLHSITSGAKRGATVTASVVQAMGHAMGTAGHVVGHAVTTVMEAGNEGHARIADGGGGSSHHQVSHGASDCASPESSGTACSSQDRSREPSITDERVALRLVDRARQYATDTDRVEQPAVAGMSAPHSGSAHEAAEALHERGQQLQTLSGAADTLQADAEEFALAAQRMRQKAQKRAGKWRPF